MSRLSALIRNRSYYRFRLAAAAARIGGGGRAYRLDRSVENLDYFFNVIPHRKLVYIEIPKAGCTTIKALLSRAVYRVSLPDHAEWHDRKKSKLPSPSDVGVRSFEALLADPETIVFSVVRNPFSRLASCYMDKFAHLRFSNRHDVLIRHLLESRYASRLSKEDLESDRLSFEHFVSYACSTAAIGVNGHWSLMSRIIPPPDLLDVKIVRLESLSGGMEPVLARLGDADGLRGSLRRPLNAARSRESVAWTKSLVAQVRRAYAEDFARFAYEAVPPGGV